MNIYILYTLTGQVMWGLLPLFWMLLQDVPSMYILATRIVWSALFCYGLILQKHLVPELKNVLHDRQEWPYIFGACIMITTNWGCFIYAMTHNHILQASLAYFINPIVVILFGAIIFHEHLGMFQRLSILFAAAGLGIAFFLFGQVPYLSLCICLSWAAYSLLKKKITLDSQISVFIESFSMVPLALAYIAFCEFTSAGAVGVLQGWHWLLLPATGIVTAVPILFFTAGLKGSPVTISGICMYLAPSISLLIGLLNGEALTQPLLVTFSFTWIAVILYLTGVLQITKHLKGHAC
ncbi:transporter [Megasphaera cerevisiae DSM 20462]|uniref:Transporter n=1 Tax=Megasphaera cerevisiae DSM 20462 TaxID=1122219 RepID=A0A0J6WTH2_9FIRM|nr:EamA family transporter RarD [Megasphaera cerevisiae]KMO86835.1 transporter [Megasphaera cerevisiae DSM 20462]MCI1750982.1 EamA family transporter RarD [Megasphaera cerevisiae]OKY54224.1 transporter [Megasphaera cerevisiae]SJZ84785.1 chloramphenicol-sensitive protein RarD [Megasphaera cerevisiae DSM 20462]